MGLADQRLLCFADRLERSLGTGQTEELLNSMEDRVSGLWGNPRDGQRARKGPSRLVWDGC